VLHYLLGGGRDEREEREIILNKSEQIREQIRVFYRYSYNIKET
jgi:hypothetical protein